MVNVPEFEGENSARVQGGRYPAQIWKAFMDKAHANLPIEDWQLPPAPARPAALLYLPGNQCIARRAAPVVPGQPGASTTTTTEPVQPFGIADHPVAAAVRRHGPAPGGDPAAATTGGRLAAAHPGGGAAGHHTAPELRGGTHHDAGHDADDASGAAGTWDHHLA